MSEELFTGTYLQAMSALIEKGLTPITWEERAERRVAARGTPQEQEEWGNWHDTGDSMTRMTSGGAKIVVASPFLRAVTPETELANYGIGHDKDPYPSVVEIPEKVVKKEFNRHLEPGEAEHHPGYLILANGRSELIHEYDNALRSLRKERKLDPRNAMGFFVQDATKTQHVERPVVLERFVDYGRGGVVGRDLGYGARLVGDSAGGAALVNLDDAVTSVYSRLKGLVPEANEAQALEALRTELKPVVAARDDKYKTRVIGVTLEVAREYLGQKPFGELEERLKGMK
ncbi:MAG: hypothetical protein ABIA93_05580 [Candidatus Woesearchaeota archaeon]